MYNKIPQDLYQICYITFPKRNVLRTSVAYEIHLIMNSGKKHKGISTSYERHGHMWDVCSFYSHNHTYALYIHTYKSKYTRLYVCV